MNAQLVPLQILLQSSATQVARMGVLGELVAFLFAF
jgi:hypothetical protein